jgi:hypothetical protein
MTKDKEENRNMKQEYLKKLKHIPEVIKERWQENLIIYPIYFKEQLKWAKRRSYYHVIR